MEYRRWRQGYEFIQDPTAPTNGGDLDAKQTMHQATSQPVEQTEERRLKAEAILWQSQDLLWDSPATDYLEGRALEGQVWQAFGLGFRANVSLPDTWDNNAKQLTHLPQPAIAFPWFKKGKLNGIRYRFLQQHVYMDVHGRDRQVKQTEEPGSIFADMVFGSQALSREQMRWRCLLLCEDELNCMSAWQAQHEAGLEVVSIGSHNGTLPQGVLQYAEKFDFVLVWTDETQVAQQLRVALPGAVSIESPEGKDANDLLKQSLLGGFLAETRERAARNNDDLEDLLWALYDAAMLPMGIDTGTATVLQRLAAQLGKKAEIYMPEPNRWITSWIPTWD